MDRLNGIKTINPIIDLMPKETPTQKVQRLAGLALRSFLIEVGILKTIFAIMSAILTYYLTFVLQSINQPEILSVERIICILLTLLFMWVSLKYVIDWTDSIIRWIALGVFKDE